MALKFQNTKADELILLHDFYFESSEPDAPKKKFHNLSKEEQSLVRSKYHLGQIRTVFDENRPVGFVGFYPDDADSVNIFYVISPAERGKGYLAEILKLSVEYCRKKFSSYQYIRALTRDQNIPSIKGLRQSGFIRKGSVVEEIQSDIIYEEYLLHINRE